jgi:flagellar hook-associated protein 1 FlgK
MSLASILDIARSALYTQQKAVDVASHNLANASTEGYTRQRLPLVPQDPLRTPDGMIGRGVTSNAIERLRNRFLDDTYHTESGLLGQQQTMQEMLQQVESVMGDLTDAGLAPTLDNFLDAWSDLSNDPSSATARTMVQQSGQALAQQFRTLNSRISSVAADAQGRLQSDVTQINALTRQIYELNVRIVSVQATGGAPDLADQRDVAIDQLSQLVQARVIPHTDGSVGVVVGDMLLADGAGSQDIVVRSDGAGFGIGLAAGTGTFDPKGGEVKALTTFTTTALPGISAQLDQLAAALVGAVNSIHSAGTTNGGATGVNFFDPAGTTAATIALDPAVAASTASIVTGSTAAAGDGSQALAIAQLRSSGVAALGGITLGAFYEGIASSVATQANAAATAATAQTSLVQHVDAQRAAANGVNTDEELISIIKSQQAYAAAARIVSVANEMMDDVLRMV